VRGETGDSAYRARVRLLVKFLTAGCYLSFFLAVLEGYGRARLAMVVTLMVVGVAFAAASLVLAPRGSR
jgi:hypothetical protein